MENTYIIVAFVLCSFSLFFVFLFKNTNHSNNSISHNEENLTQQFNILFQMKMKNEKLGYSTDFEKRKLLEIGNILDQIRASKT